MWPPRIARQSKCQPVGDLSPRVKLLHRRNRLIRAAGSIYRGMEGFDVRTALFLLILLTLEGCGVVAFPFRVTGDAVEAVPVVGKPIGAPIHGVGDAID